MKRKDTKPSGGNARNGVYTSSAVCLKGAAIICDCTMHVYVILCTCRFGSPGSVEASYNTFADYYMKTFNCATSEGDQIYFDNTC